MLYSSRNPIDRVRSQFTFAVVGASKTGKPLPLPQSDIEAKGEVTVIQPQASETDNTLVISYLELRKFVGWLGLLMPFILIIGGCFTAVKGGIQPTISDYYYTPIRNIFVGILCAIGVFLFSYRGYPPKENQPKKPIISDNAAGNLAALFAVGVALFPTTPVCRSKRKN